MLFIIYIYNPASSNRSSVLIACSIPCSDFFIPFVLADSVFCTKNSSIPIVIRTIKSFGKTYTIT